MYALKGRDFLKLQDFAPEELQYILRAAENIKRYRGSGGDSYSRALHGMRVVLVTQKPTTRTRGSFERAVHELGGTFSFWNSHDMQVSRGETWPDTGMVMSRYYSALAARLYNQGDLEELAGGATVPVINALTDKYHPCQTMADIMTCKEKRGEGVRVAFVGDCGHNMANTTLIGCTMLGMDVTLVCPDNPKYRPDEEIVKIASQYPGRFDITHNCRKGLQGVDVVMTDVFVSMGQEQKAEERIEALQPYQVSTRLMGYAKPDAIFMHCLPANHASETAFPEILRGCEVTDEVLYGAQSVVLDQAENRVHAQEGILAALLTHMTF